MPPSPPVCKIPSSVTTGKTASLDCRDDDGSPPPTYKWYKNGVPLPAEPSKISGYQNATYVMNMSLGSLVSHEFMHIYQCRLECHSAAGFKGVFSFRCTPEHQRQTRESTTARLRIRPVLLSAAELLKWKSVSAPLRDHLKWIKSFQVWRRCAWRFHHISSRWHKRRRDRCWCNRGSAAARSTGIWPLVCQQERIPSQWVFYISLNVIILTGNHRNWLRCTSETIIRNKRYSRSANKRHQCMT